MATALNSSLAKAKAMLAGFSAGQKFVGAVLLVGLLMAGTVFYRWAAAPAYAPLFSGLSSTDASAIVDKLDSTGVQYQLSDGGSTVAVPKDQVYAQRVSLAGQGLPAKETSEGYGLLDKQSMTSSTFQQQITYQRALEGELSKTVNAIDGVQTAVVHLSIPAKSVFLDKESAPKASVLLALRPGAQLTNPQVRSIVNLVGSSVPDLDSKDVTVADAAGTLFSAPGLDQGAAGVDTNAQQTASYEAQEAAGIQAVLDRVVGPGRAVAKVSATLDYDQTTLRNTRVYTDKAAKPGSTAVEKESMDGGSGAGATGVLGPDNISVPTGSATAGTGKYAREKTTTDNANSQEETVKVVAPGGVLKQSVSVVVDAKLSSVDTTKLQTALATAAGIDTKRGDTIAVTSLPFDQSTATANAAELKAAEAAAKQAALIGYAKQGLMALGIIIFLLVATVSRRKRKKARAAEELVRLELLEARANTPVAPVPSLTSIDLPALEAAAAPALPQQRRKDDVLAMVERQPDEVAELLRGWLADRRG